MRAQQIDDIFQQFAALKERVRVLEASQKFRVSGMIAADGTILAGSGFSCSHTASTGIYVISFDTQWPEPPSIMFGVGESLFYYGVKLFQGVAVTESGFWALTFDVDTHAATDGNFSFCADGA